ncbi:MAG: TIGR03084 family metal-binding protein [Ilumatobacteraceae bacterium]
MRSICGDLGDEHSELDEIVAGLPDVDWERPTPSPGWAVRDQISHLWFFDQRALLALTDPAAFALDMQWLRASGVADASITPGRSISPSELVAHWRTDRRALIDVASTVDPSDRVPWYGPPMGARSFITARLMETWAHGQDVVDALSVTRTPTNRLRHVAHIGVRARPFSYMLHGLTMPPGDVAVRLTGPDGDEWSWGESEHNSVIGAALDFCLVVTQRRNVADTHLEIVGDAAAEWVRIAQAFAGGVGGGRQPGQFAATDQ